MSLQQTVGLFIAAGGGIYLLGCFLRAVQQTIRGVWYTRQRSIHYRLDDVPVPPCDQERIDIDIKWKRRN